MRPRLLPSVVGAVLTPILATAPVSTAQEIRPASVPRSPASASSSSSPSSAAPQTSNAPVHSITTTTSNTLKVLVYGDSITQGAEGDFTWRYRLWEWFQVNSKSAPALQYVGPFNGTLPASVGPNIDLNDPQTWGAYHATVDPAFYPGGGSNHFAIYGRPAWLDVDVLGGHVTKYDPDVVILHLGFNDFGWWGQKPDNVIESMQKMVWNARMARRDVTVLIADVSHRLLVKGRDDIPVTTDEYNAKLAEKVRSWSDEQSPVIMVPVSEDYDCHVEACPAGFDGLHPNSLGDFQIARAYTKILHDQFNYGQAALVVPPTRKIPGMADYSSSYLPLDTVANMSTTTFLAVMLVIGLAIAACARRPRWLREKVFRSKGVYRLLPTSVRD